MNKNIDKLIKENPDLADYISNLNMKQNELMVEYKRLIAEKTTLSKELNDIYVKSLEIENKNLKQQLEAVIFTLSKMNRTVFGTKSEKTVHKEEERNLFNLNEAEANQNLNAVEPTIDKVVKKRKTKTTKAESFKNLESREIIYDLEENDKTCHSCNVSLVEVGSKTRETIEIMKKAVKVMEKSITYKCPKCGLFHKKAMPNLPIPGGIATSSLLAQVIVDKTANALPLYRQSEDYKRIGLNISRQTLSNWMIKSSLQLEIIFNKMKDDLTSKDIIHADETTVQVLKESGKKASQKSYMWTYVSSNYDDNIVLYEYTSRRAGRNAKAFLQDFHGYLHVDGYTGYNQVDNVTLVHCMAHLRRKFHDVYVSLPKEQQANSNTSDAMDYINQIYGLDRESRNLPINERYEYKQVYIKPLMIKFRDWLNEKQLTSASQSGYGKAVNYAVNYLPTIMNYLNDGRLELDNNKAERAIKPFVIGRKNWLFSNTPNGARSSAILYSIVQTCLLNKINPYQYLAFVLDYLANHKINEIKINDILPYSKNIIEDFNMNKEQ